MTVVSLLRLRARPGRADDLMRSFAELRVFEHSRESGGFRGGRLFRPAGGGDEVVVLAEWEDAASYQGWLDNPVRAELSAGIAPLLADAVAAGEVLEEVKP